MRGIGFTIASAMLLAHYQSMLRALILGHFSDIFSSGGAPSFVVVTQAALVFSLVGSRVGLHVVHPCGSPI